MITPQLLLLHKQKTSGRLRFLRLPHGVTCFEPLPELSSLHDADYAVPVAPHPAAFMRAAAERLSLPPEAIEAEPEFQAWVESPGGDVPVLLGAFTSIDPPFAQAEALGGRFITITEGRGLSSTEMQLLRRVYEYVLG